LLSLGAPSPDSEPVRRRLEAVSDFGQFAVDLFDARVDRTALVPRQAPSFRSGATPQQGEPRDRVLACCGAVFLDSQGAVPLTQR
jgi:hypothetical protein